MTVDADAEQHLRRGVELLRAGRLDDGVAAIARAVALRPEAAHLHANLALGLLAAGRAAEALDAADAAIGRAPAMAEAHSHRGDALRALGRLEPAAESYERAIGFKPELTRAHQGLAEVQAALGRFEAALASYDRMLVLAPGSAETLSACGRLLLQLDRPAEARERLAAAAALAPAAERFGGLSSACLAMGANAEALAAAEAGLALLGEAAGATLASQLHTNRGVALLGLDRPADALDEADRALAADPASPLALNLAGVAAMALGRLEAAVGRFSAALAADGLPSSRIAEFTLNRALARLQLGDFAAGWADYAARWRAPGFVANANVDERLVSRLAFGLAPADFAGRRVLVVFEQGVGDELMFASMLPDVLRLSERVACVCQPKLARLLRGAFPQLQVFGGGEGLPADLGGFDLVVAGGDLGHAFRRRREDFPGEPYVRPSPEAIAAWAARLGPKRGRLRIGLSWRGGAKGTNTERRSLALDRLQGLLAHPDWEFVSLQHGEAAAEAAGRADIRTFPPDEIEDLEAVAGLIRNLDLVVTVQNTTVHLCGALGHPCLAMVAARPEWRYASASADMPWYRSVRLVRQAADGDWDPVIARVAAAVEAHAAATP